MTIATATINAIAMSSASVTIKSGTAKRPFMAAVGDNRPSFLNLEPGAMTTHGAVKNADGAILSRFVRASPLDVAGGLSIAGVVLAAVALLIVPGPG